MQFLPFYCNCILYTLYVKQFSRIARGFHNKIYLIKEKFNISKRELELLSKIISVTNITKFGRCARTLNHGQTERFPR